MLQTYLHTFFLQNGGSTPLKENSQCKRSKKRKESSDSQLSEKAKKSRKKKSKKSRERREERRDERREESRRSSCSPLHNSDPAASESEEDYSLCAAPWCREPEGDEVRTEHFLFHCTALYLIYHFLCETRKKGQIQNTVGY